MTEIAKEIGSDIYVKEEGCCSAMRATVCSMQVQLYACLSAVAAMIPLISALYSRLLIGSAGTASRILLGLIDRIGGMEFLRKPLGDGPLPHRGTPGEFSLYT